MNINSIFVQEKENIKQTKKRAGRNVTVAIIACALVFVSQLFVSLLLAPFITLLPVSPEPYIISIIEIAAYIFYIGVPFLVSMLIYHFVDKEKHYHVVRSSPKSPVLFILGALGCSYAINIIVSIIFPFLNEFGEPVEIVANTPLEIALCFVMYAILPPILEEWAFRGIILKRLLPYGKWGAIIISALLFALGHLHPSSIINAFTFGIILGICYEYTGSLKIPMIIHFINNTISTTVSLIPEESILMIILSLIMIAFIGCAIVGIVYYINNGFKRHKYTIKKPDIIGYKLTISQYLRRFILNFATIPYALLFAFYFYLAFVFNV